MLLLAVGHAVSAELHIGSWPDYLPDTLIKKFQAETGIKTTLDTYASDAALTQKLQSGGGGYDVVIAGDYYVPVLVKSGLLQKLDKNKLPNIANVKPEYRHPSFDPQRDYAMPYTVVLTGFAYDSARVSGGNSTRVGSRSSIRQRSCADRSATWMSKRSCIWPRVGIWDRMNAQKILLMRSGCSTFCKNRNRS